ncbi:MAG: hypothetical protein WEB88_13865 [Gemmatimonadota bacterium]
MSQKIVRYAIRLPDGLERAFAVDVGSTGVGLPREKPVPRPAWTELEHNKCPHCPLTADEHPHCPAAVGLAELVDAIGDVHSFERVDVTVESDERRVEFKAVELQNVLGSLLGLLMPMSGCPHTAFFRPMARFHLPLSTIQETVFRSAGSFLLAEWLRRSEGAEEVTFDLRRLTEIYQRIQIVNRHLHGRLQDATSTDSSLNAVALLDALAQILPMEVDGSLKSMRPLFEAYLDEGAEEAEEPPA